MPRFLFPFRFGAVPAAAPSAVTEEAAPSRWANVSGAAKSWQVHTPSLLPRFEHVRWALGRREWNGGIQSGQLNFVVDSESGFVISENAIAVIASESTLNK